MIFTSICAQFFENFFNYGKGYDDIPWAESNPSWTKPFVQCTWSLCFDSLKKTLIYLINNFVSILRRFWLKKYLFSYLQIIMDTNVNPLQRINCYVIDIRVAYIFGAREGEWCSYPDETVQGRLVDGCSLHAPGFQNGWLVLFLVHHSCLKKNSKFEQGGQTFLSGTTDNIFNL